MQKCFVCLICTHFALWAMIRAEYGIKKNTGVSYLWMEFPLVTEAIFPRHLTINLSITNFVGPLVYSIDANGNQLIVTMSGTSMNLLVESMGGQQQKINLRQLCRCKVCLYVPLLLEFGMDNSTFWTLCNGGLKSTVPFNSNNRSFKKGYPTLKQKQKGTSSTSNSADLYFVNYPGGLLDQMQGCIFAIEYNGQPIGNNMRIVGQDIAKGCHRTCSIDTCKGGVCYDTYGSEPICDCSTVFGNGRYCSDDSQLVNKQFHHTFPKFVGIKLSWRSEKNIFWRIGNKQWTWTLTIDASRQLVLTRQDSQRKLIDKIFVNIIQSTLTLTIDDSNQLALTRQDSQRKSIDTNILLTEYIPNESYVLILRSNETNSFKNENNVTVIYANYDALKDGDDFYDDMILSSCYGVMDMAILSGEYGLQWDRWKMEESQSSAYIPACDFPVKRVSLPGAINVLTWLLAFIGLPTFVYHIPFYVDNFIRTIRGHMLYGRRLLISLFKCIRGIRKHSNDDIEEMRNLNNPINDEGHDKDLFSAAADGRLDDVKYLIDKCADVNTVDDWKMTALHYASENDHLVVVQYLIDKGANVNVGDGGKMTSLHYASKNGHLKIVKYLIIIGADVNAVDYRKMTALHHAAEKDHLEVVKYLIDKDADVNAMNRSSRTPLKLAEVFGHHDVVRYLKRFC